MTPEFTPSPLAIAGGSALRRRPWPAWPPTEPDLLEQVGNATRSGDWAISGFARGASNLDQRFSSAFAEYLGVPHVVPCDHGSSALVMALEALGVGRGDEVIVPGLTWVACASAVERVNAEPVLVDVEARTLCLDPQAVRAAITGRTAAILVVHLYSAMADMDELLASAARHGLPIVEDSAQAHGAQWRGRRAGTLGDIGTFSFQQGKVLTCGEGGAVVTSDGRLAAVLEQIRGDGRRYLNGRAAPGRMQLEEIGAVRGRNYGLSGFQLGALLAALPHLDEQNAHRLRCAEYLVRQIERRLEGVESIEVLPPNDLRVFYHFPIRFLPAAFAHRSAETLSQALSAELGTWVHPPYPPLSRHLLLAARDGRRFSGSRRRFRTVPEGLPVAEEQIRRTLLLHHSCLLGSEQDMDDVVAALEKVQRHAASLPEPNDEHVSRTAS